MIGRIGIAAAVAVAMTLGAAAQATAEPEKKNQLSERAVRMLMGMALTGMPQEMKTKDGKTVKIDKNKPDEILIPIEDGRRVIQVGRVSAYAEACEMPELQLSNYKAFMFSEQKRNKWSRLQLIYINRLHLFTLALMTGQLEANEEQPSDAKPSDAKPSDAKPSDAKPGDAKADKAETGAAEKGDKKPTGDKAGAPTFKSKVGKLECPPERKEQVRKQIESFVEEVQKSAS